MKLRHKKRAWRIVALVIGIVLLAIVGALVWHVTTPLTPAAKPTQATVKVAAVPVSIASNTLFMGDTYWGRYINQWSMASSLKTAYPFSRLNEFHRDQYDAWIANMECPSVAGLNLTAAQEDATLTFNCSPDYLPEYAKWFTAVSLANNHSGNQGAAGFAETQTHLTNNGIQYFGSSDPTHTSDICDVIAMPFTVTYSDKSTKEQPLPIALCGYDGVFQIPPAASIAVMEQYAPYMPVIAMPHMGVEYTPAPNSIDTATYHAMIDDGADMVIGGHPHWVQTSEAYKGKLIVYSMGNFIFDQQGNPEVTRSAAINVKMDATNVDSTSLAAWLKIGAQCKTYHDDCLQQAEQQKLTKLPMTFQFGVVGSDSANKITKPATADVTAGILQRLQWTTTMSGLSAPESSI
jgi:hypothetical protein